MEDNADTIDLDGTPEGYFIEAVMAMDDRFFEEHPEALNYEREYVPNEFAPYTTADLAPPRSVLTVTVRKLGPGVRTRHVRWEMAIAEPALSTVN